LLAYDRAGEAVQRILIIDEPGFNIDNGTDSTIQTARAPVLRGRTSVVIAHRLSTIRTADLILVIDSGRIVERGTHAVLLAKNGKYAELYNRQFRDLPAAVAG
jgi:ABC-type multidrug transport system fused ATPase/permease subunit